MALLLLPTGITASKLITTGAPITFMLGFMTSNDVITKRLDQLNLEARIFLILSLIILPISFLLSCVASWFLMAQIFGLSPNVLSVIPVGVILTEILYPLSKFADPDRDFEIDSEVDVSDLYSDRRKSENIGAIIGWVIFSWA